MRTIFSLMLSLALAVGFCLLLVTAGVLKFNDDGVVANLKPVAEKVQSRIKTVLDTLPHPNEHTSPLDGQEISSSPSAEDQVSPIPAPATVPAQHAPGGIGLKSIIYIRALEFLSARAGKGGADIEERFADFLMRELDLDQKETARLVRMSFWKNFVTLQHQWLPEGSVKMRLAFSREKALKQAGFAAKGLTLMASEVQEAKARLQGLERQLSENAQEGEKL